MEYTVVMMMMMGYNGVRIASEDGVECDGVHVGNNDDGRGIPWST